jgi:hypothetical protein
MEYTGEELPKLIQRGNLLVGGLLQFLRVHIIHERQHSLQGEFQGQVGAESRDDRNDETGQLPSTSRSICTLLIRI